MRFSSARERAEGSGLVVWPLVLDRFEHLDRMTGHDRRDRVFVDQLRVAIAPQQDAEIVKPRDDALKLHSIDQKYGQWDFVFPYEVQECILQVLGAFGRHFLIPFDGWLRQQLSLARKIELFYLRS
jgi:hypothetical protein